MEQVVDQVYGILSKEGIHFDSREDGNEYRVRFDSAYVFVSFEERADTIVVSLRCPLLQEVDEVVAGREKLLTAVNDLNGSIMFGKACWYADRKLVELEHYLRGNDLQAKDLIHALRTLASTAEERDDAMQKDLGTGKRGSDVWTTPGEEPVVET